ncbi:uncharacterized protein ASCRUDRAFT_75867 [Ascoidea rubescens DSM 1968]|uniref:WD40 repeat-like protein n=1 Tax=Ascoidea rubescens DSM 1968 TaxID=1344418 RepID=A0A1D2VHX4_9ASCO|nr:hypothetical protein ASCRUDRAFT_75867 [Ascoidea rubescens DSM 1968]ODV61150.1 hypothetical protein ASCRUDRAFT_75867 [Ascoidea rubescens DSM 1968]
MSSKRDICESINLVHCNSSELYIPEVFDNSYSTKNGEEDSLSISFNLKESINCIDWYKDIIALGSDQNLVILSSINEFSNKNTVKEENNLSYLSNTLSTDFQRKNIRIVKLFKNNELFEDSIKSIDLIRITSKLVLVGSFNSGVLVLINHSNYFSFKNNAIIGNGNGNGNDNEKSFNDVGNSTFENENLEFLRIDTNKKNIINFDINDEGIISVITDDKLVSIYDYKISIKEPIRIFKLTNNGIKVKFMKNNRSILVLEDKNIIRILNYIDLNVSQSNNQNNQNKKRLIKKNYQTIFINNSFNLNENNEILEVFENSDESNDEENILVLFKNGIYKIFSILYNEHINVPIKVGRLEGFLDKGGFDKFDSDYDNFTSKLVSSSLSNDKNRLLIGKLGKKNCIFYDLRENEIESASLSLSLLSKNGKNTINSSNNNFLFNKVENNQHMRQLRMNLPSYEINCGSINHKGIVGFISGYKLILSKPFESNSYF